MMLTTDPRKALAFKQGVISQAVGAATEVLGAAIDTKGWDYVIIVVNGGANAGTDNNAAAVIKQSATSGGSYAAVTGTSIGYAATDDNVFRWGIMKTSALTDGTFIKPSATGGAAGTWTTGITVILCNSKDTVTFPPTVAASFDVS